MRGRRVAAWSAAAALWTFIAWGSRIDFITSEDARDPWNWLRIGGSLLLGVALVVAAIALWIGRPFGRPMATVFVAFATLTLAVWLRSAISVLSGDETAAFKAVHVVLATISIAFGLVLGRVGLDRLRS